jgi:ribosomal protein S18 acetylase RimI-like enzyme
MVSSKSAVDGLTIRNYQSSDRGRVLDFIFYQAQTHYHLDWEPVQAWLGDNQTLTLVACEDGGTLRGVMAFSPPNQYTAWLRLLGLSPDDPEAIFAALWEAAYPLLIPRLATISATVAEEWLPNLLEMVGFYQNDTVINLIRPRQPLPLVPPASVRIRGVRPWEISHVLGIDHAAFPPLWQMREPDLRAAGRRAHRYTVALNNAGIVGYQMAMRHDNNIHLARLATLPQHQNTGIATHLLIDLIQRADKWHVDTITVNTQLSNESSRHLYDRFGFERDYKDLPVYSLDLA